MYEWIEGDYEKVIGQALEKKDNSENCPHFAEQKSLFEFPFKTDSEMVQAHYEEDEEMPPLEDAEPANTAEESSQKEDL